MIYFDKNHNAYGDELSIEGKEIVYTCEDELWNDFNANPQKYIWQNDIIVINPEWEKIVEEKQKQEQIKSLQGQLDTLDLKTIRALRAIQAGTGTEEDTAKLEELENQAEELRQQIKDIINPPVDEESSSAGEEEQTDETQPDETI